MKLLDVHVQALCQPMYCAQERHIVTCVNWPFEDRQDVEHWPAFELSCVSFQCPSFQAGECLFFVSRFAIDAFFQGLSLFEKKHLLSLNLVWAAVGDKSTQHLKGYLEGRGFQGTLLPPSKQESGQGFYQSIKKSGRYFPRVYVLRADRGNQYWIDQMRKEDWDIRCVQVYHRGLKDYADQIHDLIQTWGSKQVIWHWYSSEAVRRFVEQFRMQNALMYLYDSKHICSHHRIAQTLKSELL